jgi:hypothetical protein
MQNKSNVYFAFFLSIAFLLLSLFFVSYHELWLDESYHYLLARDSKSFTDLIHNGTPTGHPILWNLVLFYYKIILPGVFAMQFLHCFIASVCVFTIACFSPFSRIQKFLIAFGYFFLYEYNIIAKNYILGFTLVFIVLALSDRKKPLWLIAVLLALASNMHLFTLFISLFLFSYLFFYHYKSQTKTIIFLSVGILLLGLVIAFMQIIPPLSVIKEYKSYDSPSFFSMDRLGRSLSAINRGLVNIPDFRLHSYWNSNLIYNTSHYLAYFISFVFIFLIFFVYKNNKPVLLLFFCPALCILFFVYLAPLATGVRYWGYFYVLFIICNWLYKNKYTESYFTKYVFLFVLSLQFIISIPALIVEYKFPFSNGKNAAESLKQTQNIKHPLFLQILAIGPSLSAYSDKKIYYPASKSFESYSYNIPSKNYAPIAFVETSINDLISMKGDTCILVLNESISDSICHNYHLKKISSHLNAISSSENYYLYLLSIKK